MIQIIFYPLNISFNYFVSIHEPKANISNENWISWILNIISIENSLFLDTNSRFENFQIFWKIIQFWLFVRRLNFLRGSVSTFSVKLPLFFFPYLQNMQIPFLFSQLRILHDMFIIIVVDFVYCLKCVMNNVIDLRKTIFIQDNNKNSVEHFLENYKINQ